eukprot:10374793-Ditylum_brightwellii.AAC.1
MQHVESRRLLKALYDSGGSCTMIHTRALPVGITPLLTEGGGQTMQTITGAFTMNRKVQVSEILLPEFSKTKQVDGIAAHVFDALRLESQ